MHLELKNDCFELNLQFKDNCGEASLSPRTFKAENNDNPYDELGAAHNKGLEYIARKFGDYIVIEDEIMMKLHEEHPQYGWDSNAGYPTTKHRNAIAKLRINAHGLALP